MEERKYIAVPLSSIITNVLVPFRIYVRQDERYVLWGHEDDRLDSMRLGELYDHALKEVFIALCDKPRYDEYFEQNLEKILKWNQLQIMKRYRLDGVLEETSPVGKVFADASCDISGRRRIGRKKTPVIQILEIIDEYESMGLRKVDICHKYKIPMTTFDYWKVKYKNHDVVNH